MMAVRVRPDSGRPLADYSRRLASLWHAAYVAQFDRVGTVAAEPTPRMCTLCAFLQRGMARGWASGWIAHNCTEWQGHGS